ncbi:50S ribosomal protein L3 [Candidatus Pacearchaeota archaeon]|nr:50S ribosomal protein L3P [uncultured archaeon]MBS3089441.1 50S ribosomal protein L3 [Candidatus Pacearchaeota archaeon]
MAKLSKPHAGSLQFWPRKRAENLIPRVNWDPVKGDGILGFIAYKVGMATAIVKDTSDKSMTLNKKVFIPVTILEAPPMKVFSVRFYKNGKVLKDVIVSNEPSLKRYLRVPKQIGHLNAPEGFDNIHLIVYSLVSQTDVKKTPDLIEVAVGGANKLELTKSLINKELSFKEFFNHPMLDIRGVTKGKGFEGPVPRFGISLKSHKSEKGVRRPGSLAPWHPARVTFRTPQAGQLGLFSRVHYNIRVIAQGNSKDKNINPGTGFSHYGKIQSDYILVKGSVQGPSKRAVLLTPSFRPTRFQSKKKYEFTELVI